MDRLKQIAAQISEQAQPPVHQWQPEEIGVIDISIDANGFWRHEGDLITRDKLVQLFASILWFENGQHYLVTPVEKLAIDVADSAFVIHQVEQVGDAWVVVTNTHEQVIISESNPVELRQYKGQWVPYINVRYDLWGRVNRSIYVQWVNQALEDSADDNLMLSSGGYQFSVAK